ncbi:MAG: ATP-grasp fold amidoligase family protein [Candidatus Fimimorpha sp.]
MRDKLMHYIAWGLNKPIIRNIFPDRWYISIRYKEHMNEKLNLKNPQTFNEKMQWLKINNRVPMYTQLVDKYKVREYVEKKIGKEYLIPLVGGPWERETDIDFSALPSAFVMKCNHDSASVVICKDKREIDSESIKAKLGKALRYNYFWLSREWPYKNVKPCIIAEKFMQDDSGEDLRDYKFFCFNGEVKCFKVDFDRFQNHRANYYDIDEKLLPFGEEKCPPDFNKQLLMPDNLQEMIHLASILSEELPFARVDFYNINGHIYFGEITFFPASGFGRFIPNEWDRILGEWIKII